MNNRKIRIGTRGSRLALAQVDIVVAKLNQSYPALENEIVVIRTSGDADKHSALEEIGGNGAFTKKIENELLAGNIDIAIHSAKDLPAKMIDGLMIGAVPLRESYHDVWLSRENITIDNIPAGSVVGTSSPRRRSMLKNIRPDLDVKNIRGNVETRIKKMDNGDYDALIMAHAGLIRLKLDKSISSLLPIDNFLPAAGQGTIVVQIRESDDECNKLLADIDNYKSHRQLDIERVVLQKLQAGCQTPLGVLAIIENEDKILHCTLLSKDGQKRIDVTEKQNINEEDNILVDKVVKKLFEQGAEDLLKE